MKFKYRGLICIISFVVILFSCEKEIAYPEDYRTTRELFSILDEWYYWKDTIKEFVVDDYENPAELLDAMKFKPKDKWSYVTTKEEHSQYYEEGIFLGHGFGYDPDKEGKVRISFVFENSEFFKFGVRRGWIINKINNQLVNKDSEINSMLGQSELGVKNTFEFILPDKTTVIGTFSKELIEMNTVLYKKIINHEGHKTGYFVFKNFIGPSKEELVEAFAYFKNGNIDELIIDLRYNSGGRTDVVDLLAGLIIPDNLNGKFFYKYIHNKEKSDKNIIKNFVQDPNSLKLSRIYFIAGKRSASASELIINSLKPYLDVFIVGDDTYGKPVGMYSFTSNTSNLVYVPVTFKLLNADNYGGYYDGLKADSYVEDDLLSDFGVEESILGEVLYHIENGIFSGAKLSGRRYRKVKDIVSIKDEIGAY